MAKKPELTEEEKRAKELVEATAQAIVDMAQGIRVILGGRLKKQAIVILLQEAMGGRSNVSKEFLSKMLDEMAKLDKTFLK